MDLLHILILAVVQGVAEFLPVSSSGHLVIAEALMGIDHAQIDLVEVNIVLHAGTLASILIFYWRRIWNLLGEDRRVIALLIVGTLPAVLVGFPMKHYGESLLESPLLAGLMLPVTGLMLVWAARRKPGELRYQQISFGQALLIGAFQAVAILPGISRSGATIAAGIFTGMRRESAATFSFLLAIPAIAGATVLELKDLLTDKPASTTPGVLAIGALVAMLVGLVSLWWLIRWVQRGRLHYFAYWCIPVGVAVTLWQLVV